MSYQKKYKHVIGANSISWWGLKLLNASIILLRISVNGCFCLDPINTFVKIYILIFFLFVLLVLVSLMLKVENID